MKISIIAFTDNGMEIAYKLFNSLSQDELNDVNFTRCGKGALSAWSEEHFSHSDALVFIGAIGIALRAIAPYIKTKTKDPAVVVVDELGQFSIPILSGHIGGANELAIKISEILKMAGLECYCELMQHMTIFSNEKTSKLQSKWRRME